MKCIDQTNKDVSSWIKKCILSIIWGVYLLDNKGYTMNHEAVTWILFSVDNSQFSRSLIVMKGITLMIKIPLT